MAPARRYWKACLPLSLVSCPIGLHTATSSIERISFRQISRKTGNRFGSKWSMRSRDSRSMPTTRRGHEYAKISFITVEDEELVAVEAESNHTIEIDRIVPRAGVDERFLATPYYPSRTMQSAWRRSRSSAKPCAARGLAALGRVVLAKREHVVMLQPRNRGLLGTTLRNLSEVRRPPGAASRSPL